MSQVHLDSFVADLKRINPRLNETSGDLKDLIAYLKQTVDKPSPLTLAQARKKYRGKGRIKKYVPAMKRLVYIWGKGSKVYPLSAATWSCQSCGEQVEGSFDVCWNCGTFKDGRSDLTFEREPDMTRSEDVGERFSSPNDLDQQDGSGQSVLMGFVQSFRSFLWSDHFLARVYRWIAIVIIAWFGARNLADLFLGQ